MSLFKQGRYSGYLRPISYIIDLLIINVIAVFYLFKDSYPFAFLMLISISWFFLSVYSQAHLSSIHTKAHPYLLLFSKPSGYPDALPAPPHR